MNNTSMHKLKKVGDNMQNANNSVIQNNYVESANFAKDCAPSICTVDILYIYI